MRNSRFYENEIHNSNDSLPTFHPGGRMDKPSSSSSSSFSNEKKPLLLNSSNLAQHLWLVILFIMLIACITLDVSMTSSTSSSSFKSVSSSNTIQDNLYRRGDDGSEEEDNNNNNNNNNRNYNSSNAAARPASVISSWFPSATESSEEFFWEQERSDMTEVSALPEHHLRPLVISGPSGVGKGTLIDMLLNHYGKDTFGFSVSETTRGPRPGEIHGQHYYFTERTVMDQEIKQGLFLEHAEVHGNLYGTSFQSVNTVTESGRICILDIDIQGVKHIHSSEQNNKLSLPPHFIFIAPPSMELLEKRLRNRGTETEEAIQKRLGNARAEVEYGTKNGHFDHVIVNDDLSKAFFHLKMILEEWYPHIHLLQRIR